MSHCIRVMGRTENLGEKVVEKWYVPFREHQNCVTDKISLRKPVTSMNWTTSFKIVFSAPMISDF